MRAATGCGTVDGSVMTISEWNIQDLPDEIEPRPRRRTPPSVGVAVILLVLLAVSVVAGARVRTLDGNGAVDPARTLPTAGTCLAWQVNPDNQFIPLVGTIGQVDCAQLHQAEVLQAWRTGQQPSSSTIEQTCRLPGTSFAGSFVLTGATDWTAPVATLGTTVVSSGTGALDFLACVLVQRDESIRRPLMSLVGHVDVTQAFTPGRWCLVDVGRSVGCQQPHTTERLGIFFAGQQQTPDTSCRDFAAQVIGSDAALGDVSGPTTLSSDTATADSSAYAQPAEYCDVRAPSGRTLTGSVVALGDQPLPLG